MVDWLNPDLIETLHRSANCLKGEIETRINIVHPTPVVSTSGRPLENINRWSQVVSKGHSLLMIKVSRMSLIDDRERINVYREWGSYWILDNKAVEELMSPRRTSRRSGRRMIELRGEIQVINVKGCHKDKNLSSL